MWKSFAAFLPLILLYALPASASGGGGGAEPVPEVGFSDIPNFPAQPIRQSRLRHFRWHPSCVCYRWHPNTAGPFVDRRAVAGAPERMAQKL